MALPKGAMIFTICTLLVTATHGHGDEAKGDSSSATQCTKPLNKTSFPKGFLWGTASSAFQYEGAAQKDGRGLSIWDVYAKDRPDKIEDHSNADVAEDFYHRYKEDIQLMKQMGLDSFRFSISWSRVLPKGTMDGGVNKLGVKFYNNLIDELVDQGITPMATLFHWDLPQELHKEYGGPLSSKFVTDFANYADLCFKKFGDRVKYWATFNEPFVFSKLGYNDGSMAPGRCSKYVGKGDCPAGNSATEPYIVAHHQLLAHASAVKIYRDKYQKSQKGKIGIALNCGWGIPLNPDTEADVKAAKRAIEFSLDWFANPVVYGDYPKNMKSMVGKRLPKFSKEQSKLLKGSIDFMGMNYYSTNYVTDVPHPTTHNQSLSTDPQVNTTFIKNGVPIGEKTASDWLYIYPKGFYELLIYLNKKYKVPVYITENGVSEINKRSKTVTTKDLQDTQRIKYFQLHLQTLLEAIKDGADIRGYYAWSLLDNFEWATGYSVRFGLIYVDYENHLNRHFKDSAYWFKQFLMH